MTWLLFLCLFLTGSETTGGSEDGRAEIDPDG
jgi:hypothetical protein